MVQKGVVPDHLRDRFTLLDGLNPSPPPPPWREAGTRAVGRLEAVGFGDDSDLLLVVSSSGRGVIDCASGELIARDDADFDFNVATLVCDGIGPLSGQSIRLSGLYGGGLPNQAEDGWGLERHPLSWPIDEVFLTPPGETMLWTKIGVAPSLTKLPTSVTELRAFGFSPTGRSFVLAYSSDVATYVR